LLDYPYSDLDYMVYDIRTVEEAFTFRQSPRQTLELGGGECSDFHTLGAYLLRTAGGFGPDDVYVLQTFGVGGMHNVIVYRDPGTGLWNIMNYGRIYQTAAAAPREAVEAVFGNPGRYEVYRAGGADEDVFTIHHLDRDSFTAVMQGLQFLPGLQGMDGVFSSVPGLGSADTRQLYGRSLSAGNRDLSAQWDGLTARVRLNDTLQLTAAGLGWLSRPASADDWTLGGKLFAPNVQSLFAAFEFGRLARDRWHWTSVGLGYRNMGSITTGWETFPQLAPFIAHQQGARYHLVGGPVRAGFRLSLDWNAHASVGLPLALTEEGRYSIADSSNGLAGVIDPNAFGWAMLGADTGLEAEGWIGRELSLSAGVRYRGELNDPTLQLVLNAVEVNAGLRYQTAGGGFAFEVAGTPVGGIWAHDSLYRTGLTGNLALSPVWALEGALSVGQYVDLSLFLFTCEALRFHLADGTDIAFRHKLIWICGAAAHDFGLAVSLSY
jgi:hypothetical protein